MARSRVLPSRACAVLAAGIVSMLLAGSSVRAATFSVTSEADSGTGSLREAIGLANASAGPHTITLEDGVFIITTDTAANTGFGPSAFVIDQDITIESAGTTGTLIQRNGTLTNARFFTVNSGAALTLHNLRLSDGGIFGFSGGGSQHGGKGGGSAGLGGAIYNRGTLAVEGCLFTGNAAQGGNGGGNTGAGSGGGGGGGGLETSGNGTGGVDGGHGGLPNGGTGGATFGNPGTDGGVGGGGGGAAIGNDFTAPGAPGLGGFGGGGGGSGEHAGTGTSKDGGAGGFGAGGGGSGAGTTQGAGGAGGYGGGKGGQGASLVTSTFAMGGSGGGGAGMGGAIFNEAGTVTVLNSTFVDNRAMGGDGGSIFESEEMGGPGQGLGGGIFNYNGTLTVKSCTFTDGQADDGGGAIFNLGDGDTATAAVTNSILANTVNGADDFAADTANAGTSSTAGGSFNLIEHQTSFAGGIASTSDPMLGSLTSNGGPQQTLLPQLGSPALDAGTAAGLTTDMRGFARTADLANTANGDDGTDIGAVEFNMNLAIAKSCDAGSEPVYAGETVTYTLTVTTSGPDTAHNVAVLDTLPAGLDFVNVTTDTGSAGFSSGDVTADLGDLPGGSTAVVTIVATVNSDAAGTVSNTADASADEDETDAADNSDTAFFAVHAGLGSLYIAKGKFAIDWSKHHDSLDADTFSISGVLNQAGIGSDLSAATVQVFVGGIALSPPVALDAAGKATDTSASPGFKFKLSAKTGKYAFALTKLDLRPMVDLTEEDAVGNVQLRVRVQINGANLLVDNPSGAFAFGFKSAAGKKSSGAFSYKKNLTVSGLFLPLKVSATESATGHVIAAACAFAPPGGGPVLIADGTGDDVSLALGTAAAIGLAATDFTRSGTDDNTSSFALNKEAEPLLKTFKLINKTRAVVWGTNDVPGTGLPLAGAGPLATDFDVGLSINAPGMTVLGQATIELKRKDVNSGKWKR